MYPVLEPFFLAGRNRQPGDQVDLEEGLAAELIAAGLVGERLQEADPESSPATDPEDDTMGYYRVLEPFYLCSKPRGPGDLIELTAAQAAELISAGLVGERDADVPMGDPPEDLQPGEVIEPAYSEAIAAGVIKQIDSTVDLLDLNNATLEELVALPGLGTLTAQRLIDARPHASVEAALDTLPTLRGDTRTRLEGFLTVSPLAELPASSGGPA